jgi:hypothetical protein
MYDFTYEKPTTVAEAVKKLGADVEAKALAGGMTFIPVLKQRLNKPSAVIDLAKTGMVGISATADTVTIGAMTTHGAVAASAEIKAKIPGLAEMASWIGDTQVRHRGTMGGSLANNDPSACYPAAALALGATIKTDRRSIAADDYFQGMFTTALEPDEIITEISFPVPEKSAYEKFRNPASRAGGDHRGRAERRLPPFRHGKGAGGQFHARCDCRRRDLAGRAERRYPCQRRVSRPPDRRDDKARGDEGEVTSDHDTSIASPGAAALRQSPA